MARDKTLQVRVQDTALAKIDALAERDGVTRSEIVRDILRAGIDSVDKRGAPRGLRV